MISAALVLLSAYATSSDADVAALANDHYNIALQSWGYSKAYASSIYGPDYSPAKALDGKWSSRELHKWNSASNKGPHWLVVDLGNEYTIDAAVVRHEGVFSDGNIYNTSNFAIQKSGSSKGPWIDVTEPVKGNRDNLTLLRFAPTKTRFVRLWITKGDQNGNEFARIFELELYAPKKSVNVPLVKVDWPQIPEFRHVNGRLESALSISSNVKPEGLRFTANGSTIKPTDAVLWLPVQGDKPIHVKMTTPDGISAGWNLQEGNRWLLNTMNGAIHILSSSHQDVAWMETPEWCEEMRVRLVLEPAIDLMSREPAYRFTMENMLNLFELLKNRPEKRDEIQRLIAAGQLEFGGTYNQPYEGLLGSEQMARQVYFGRRWLRKMFPGADTCVAYTVDIPGRAMQMQQVLAKAGIKYLITSRYHEGLFRWKSPDGSSILVYSMPHYGNHNVVLKSKTEESVAMVPGALKHIAQDFAARNIPPHYMLLSSGDFEGPMSFDKLIKAWSDGKPLAVVDGKPVKTPPMNYSSTAGLFKALDTPTAKPKELMGERPNMWLYIHGPTHHESISAQREATRMLPVAETFATMRCLVEGSFASYPGQALSDAWLDSIYPDHGFGGYKGHITDGVFQAKFTAARDTARQSLGQSLKAIVGHVKVNRAFGVPVTVFNPHSWQRSDLVSVLAPEAWGLWTVVDEDGKPVPSQVDRSSRHENVALVSQGATVLSATGTNADRLISTDWWDARKGCWESIQKGKEAPQVVIDLGRVQNVDRLLISHYGAWGEFEKEEILNTQSFKVYSKVGLNDSWKEMSGAPKTNKAPISEIECKPTPMRYVMVEVQTPSQAKDNTARLVNIEVQAVVEPKTPTIRFHAAQVPSLGFRTFYLVSSSKHDEVQAASANEIIENGFYKIRLAQGGIESIFDKQAKRELIRKAKLAGGEVYTVKSVGNGAGEFGEVQPVSMEGFDRAGNHKVSWQKNTELSGSLQTVFDLHVPIGGTKIRKRLTVYNFQKKIDLDVDILGWNGEKYREFRVAFPIGGPKSQVAYEVPFGTVRIGKDEIKTTGGKAYAGLDYWQEAKDIHPREVQDAISVTDGSLTTTLSSSVAVFDHIDPTKMGGNGPLIQPILLASRKSCHGWGNWYIQPGDHHYHFSLTSSTKALDGQLEAAAAQVPLLPVIVGDTDGQLPSTMSFASVSAPNVRVSTIKKAEDDDSVVMRCYNLTGSLTSIQFEIFRPIRWGMHCNIIEDELKSLTLIGGKAHEKVGPFSIETYKIKL